VTPYVAAFIAATCLSLALTNVVRKIAVRYGLVSAPKSGRHVHTSAVPRIGGIAIFLAVAIVLFVVWGRLIGTGPHPSSGKMAAIAASASLVFLLGFMDDLRGLSAYWKLAIQATGALILWFSGLSICRVHILFGARVLGTAAEIGLTVFWVLLVTNAFNLIDGLDGLAAGSALFSISVILVEALLSRDHVTLLLTATLAGAILGFLHLNFNPAKIFLGDCGSLLIGHSLATLVLLLLQKSETTMSVAVAVIAVGLPVLDLVLAVVRRLLTKRPLFGADDDHIHHRLLKLGISHRNAVVILYGVSGVFALTSLLLLYMPGKATHGTLVVLAGGVVYGVSQLRYQKYFKLRRVARRAMKQQQPIVGHSPWSRSGSVSRNF
jgi:UDP-GlcNAc:undecaprenyl-phosphate/decaprenyl-phosphate GlcNAc-1-phosphate transferase